MKGKIIIAIDGYSSCGKSSFAKEIARIMEYIYIDSGAMYRAVTPYYLKTGLVDKENIRLNSIIDNLDKISIDFLYNRDTGQYETYLNSDNVEKEIRGIEVSAFVSRISQIPEVRARMVDLQRQIGQHKGIVMDGRDIGTVVFPGAELKIFMTASLDIRAKRRYDELVSKGMSVDFEEVRKNIIARDIADENRDISPLRRADDAVVLDNSRMTIPEQLEWVMQLIASRINGS